MDDSSVQEHGCDEAPPLIGVVIVERAHTTQLAKGTLVARVAGEVACRLWTGPWCLRVRLFRALEVSRSHARYKSRTHVDQDIRGWADHRIERGMYHDG
jgi:hypothetical protein